MKKKIIIILSCIFSFFLITIFGLFIYYNNSLSKTGNDSDKVTLVINSGMTTKDILETIYNAGLIKNTKTAYIYVKLNKISNLQAGVYELNKGMDLEEILNTLTNGKVIDNTITVTFVEGKRLVYFADVISKNFPYEKEDILKKLSDTKYLQELVEKYWFLTDEILNDKLYYALEGYLYPSTYYIDKDATLEEIIDKLLYTTGAILSDYKEIIENSNYSVHEIITLASIVELEGAQSNDRKGVAGVFYNRLENGWSLGSDVTTYYAAQKDFKDDLYQYELDDVNDYNTRSATMAGKLPVGPICSPSKDSLIATLEPENHDYFFFVADKNKKTYFTKTNSEHISICQKLKNEGLWYTYN